MTTDPPTMQAVIQDGYGAPERVLRLGQIARPSPGADQVLLRVRATSVNTPDWATVAGVPYIFRLRSGLRRPTHPVRGSDVAGTVEAVGPEVTDLQPGDEVLGSLWGSADGSQAGAFAQYTVAPASQVVKKPAGLSFEAAAASVMTGLTAMIAIRDAGHARPGSRVLINGASGGVGTMAVQIAKSLGAEVTGVCSTRNIDLVHSLGAAHVIDYTQEDFTKRQQRYDVILDNVLNHSPKSTARLLAPNGVLIPNSIGNTGGLLAALPRLARAALMGKGATNVKFVTLAVNRESLNTLVRLLETDEVKVIIEQTYPLADAATAVTHVLEHHASGKVALTVKGEASGPPLAAERASRGSAAASTPQ
jgi:NADPH:quinone reductase-like Zn-dependent oxidoreductase